MPTPPPPDLAYLPPFPGVYPLLFAGGLVAVWVPRLVAATLCYKAALGDATVYVVAPCEFVNVKAMMPGPQTARSGEGG
jgi:hypothetical protein